MEFWNELNKYEKRRIVAGAFIAFAICAGITKLSTIVVPLLFGGN